MDIRPPARPQQRPATPPNQQPPIQAAAPTQAPSQLSEQPQNSQPSVIPPSSPQPIEQPPVKKSTKRKRAGIIIVALLILAIATAFIGWFWYQSQLAAVDSDNSEKVLIEIETASTPAVIASVLKENNLIKNETAFLWYTRIEGVQNQLKAGSFRLSPSESTPEIVEHLVKGTVDTFTLTFYPGATLTDTKTKAENRIDVTSVLKNAGYPEAEISAALSKQYDHPIFQTKPASADLEGYVFGETYEFFAGASVEDILVKTFDEFYRYVEQEGLIAGYEAQGLSLYEGITLASIIQRESGGDDKPEIAQVFFNRIEAGMTLGSDVTYQYIADKEGGVRDPNYDSPYNTRRYAGLPPGPIAVPGLASLRAVANPSGGDYLFFLSGDDDVTYYGRTVEEHEANIRNHCQQKCQII